MMKFFVTEEGADGFVQGLAAANKGEIHTVIMHRLHFQGGDVWRITWVDEDETIQPDD